MMKTIYQLKKHRDLSHSNTDVSRKQNVQCKELQNVNDHINHLHKGKIKSYTQSIYIN